LLYTILANQNDLKGGLKGGPWRVLKIEGKGIKIPGRHHDAGLQ